MSEALLRRGRAIYDAVHEYIRTHRTHEITNEVSVSRCTDFDFRDGEHDEVWEVVVSEWMPDDTEFAAAIGEYVREETGEPVNVRFEW